MSGKGRTKTWAVVVALAMVLAAGGWGICLRASNYGFKMRPFIAGGDGLAVALPWHNDYVNAEDLRRRTGADRVGRFSADSSFVSWTGVSGRNFSLRAPESYVVWGPPGGIAPVIVGSHAPEMLVDLAPGANLVSPPLHQIYVVAGELLQALNNHASGSVDRVCRFTTKMDMVCWTGRSGYNFYLAPGEGVVIYANRDVTDFDWEHY